MSEPWFRARTYGWGWTPASIEGWLVLLGFVVVASVSTVVFIYKVRSGTDVRSATLLFVLWIAILIAALVTVAWITGERPRWRWGEIGRAHV